MCLRASVAQAPPGSSLPLSHRPPSPGRSRNPQLTTIPVALRLLSGIQRSLAWGGPPSHRAPLLSALTSLADVLALADQPSSPGDLCTQGLACPPIARAVAVLALRQLSWR